MLGGRLLALGVVVLLPAGASAASIELGSSEQIQLDGTTTIEFAGGSVGAFLAEADGTIELRGATGTVTVWTWNETHGQAGVDVAVEQSFPEDAVSQRFEVENASIILILKKDLAFYRAAAGPGGRVEIRGDVADTGLPVRLVRDVAWDRPRFPLATTREADDVQIRWPVGSVFVGDVFLDGPLEGWPSRAAEVGIRGPASVLLHGGNVTFDGADGNVHAFALGTTADARSRETPLAQLRWETTRQLFFEGTVADARLPAEGDWGAGGPSAAWTVDGTVSWKDASGSVRDGDRTTVFQDADVVASGVLRFTDSAPALAGARRYEGEGGFRVLVDGAAVQAPRPDVPAEDVALVAALAAAFALAARAFAPFYTRIARESLLEHPRRRALYDAVVAEPGVSKRALARQMGGGWGAFVFHFRLLETGGYVRVERRGRYSLVFPVSAGRPAAIALVPNALARSCFETLPQDGTAVSLADLGSALGVPADRLRYHVRRLRDADLVDVTLLDAGVYVGRRAGGAGP